MSSAMITYLIIRANWLQCSSSYFTY